MRLIRGIDKCDSMSFIHQHIPSDIASTILCKHFIHPMISVNINMRILWSYAGQV